MFWADVSLIIFLYFVVTINWRSKNVCSHSYATSPQWMRHDVAMLFEWNIHKYNMKSQILHSTSHQNVANVFKLFWRSHANYVLANKYVPLGKKFLLQLINFFIYKWIGIIVLDLSRHEYWSCRKRCYVA